MVPDFLFRFLDDTVCRPAPPENLLPQPVSGRVIRFVLAKVIISEKGYQVVT